MKETMEEEIQFAIKATSYYVEHPVRLAKYVFQGVETMVLEFESLISNRRNTVFVYLSAALYECLAQNENFKVTLIENSSIRKVEESKAVDFKKLRRILTSYTRKSIIKKLLEEA